MIQGLRIHLTGSASRSADVAHIRAAHQFIGALVHEVVERGGGLVLGVGPEPHTESGDACIFDWTALEAVAGIGDSVSIWPPPRSGRFVVVASQRGLEKVPEHRADLWDGCRSRSDFDLQVAPPGWRMAGIIRERQVLRGDILVAVGGGAGVEHLAELYRDDGKPVVPVHTDLGALNDDGNGGSRFLYDQAIADPDKFFRIRDEEGSASARLTKLRLTAQTDPVSLSRDVAILLEGLRSRPAFYVRLLNTDHEYYEGVEAFFRGVVDSVVLERGFRPREMGRDRPENAFMNVDIFAALHRAGLVVVDLTGVRPNCTMELGYALARRRRVVISAMEGTSLPFDEDKLPTFMWSHDTDPDDLRSRFLRWFDLYSELPPIVQ